MLSPDPVKGFPRSLDETRLEPNRSGYYEVRWTERDEGGRARTRTYSCSTKDYELAKAVRDAWWSATWHMKAVSPNKTVGDLCRAYRALHMTMNDIRPAQDWSLRPIERLLGNASLADLSAGKVGEYYATRRREGVADSTIRRELGALRAVLGWAIPAKELHKDTVLPTITLPPSALGRENYLPASEADRVFAAAAADTILVGSGPNAYTRISRVGRFVCIALETAARSRSIERLKWSQVNFSTKVIDFRTPGVRVSKKRQVPVPISDVLLPVLEQAYRERTGEYVLDHPGSNVSAFESFRERVGFDATRHDLRRTWATLRAQWGVPLWDIAGVLGDSLETVTAHYAHHCPDHLRGAINTRPKK